MSRFALIASVLACMTVFAIEPLFDDGMMSHDASQWCQPNIFLPFSAISYTEKGLVLSRNEKQQPIPGKKFDTAFELKTIRKPLPEGASYFEFAICLGTNKKGLDKSRGYHASYHKCIKWFDASEKLIGLFPYSPDFSHPLETPGWQVWRGNVPSGAKYAEIDFGLDSPDFEPGEKAVVAGVKLIVGTKNEIDEATPHDGLLLPPRLVSASPTEDASAPVRVRLERIRAVNRQNLKVLFDRKDITAEVQWDGDVVSYSVNGGFAKGLHFMGFVLDGEKDNAINYEIPFYIGSPRKRNVMSIRHDGMAMKDGKPFFVLGLSCLRKATRSGNTHDGAFAEAKAAGINMANNGSGFTIDFVDSKEYLEAAAKHNIYLTWAPVRKQNSISVRDIVEGIVYQKDIDSILSWSIGDDTSSHINADELKQVYDAIKNVDPWRLTEQADPVSMFDGLGGLKTCSNYTAFTGCSDVFKPEVYPIGFCTPGAETPEITARTVPVTIRDMKQIIQDRALTGKPNSPIWPLIQYFHYDPKGKSWNRLPTRNELRAMSYLAVIHGAHGIYWYRYAGYPNTDNFRRGFSDEQWEILKSVTLEFHSLYDVFCAEPIPQTQTGAVVSGTDKDALGFASLNMLMKEHAGRKYLFVCNSAYATATFELKVPGVSRVDEYFEKRQIALKNGQFRDSFEPFGVHVYVME